VLGVDVESIVPHTGFSAESRDYANVNGVLLVENPAEGKYRLVVPFPIEAGSAEVRVISTGKVFEFKVRHGVKPAEFEELLKGLGEIPSDQKPLLDELKAAVKGFGVADVEIPAGAQVLRFHARQELLPVGGNPKSYQLELFAPLAGFILAPGGQSQVSVTIAFPTPWAAPGMQIGTPAITPAPGQPAPETQVQGPTGIAERPIYGALWRNDPKVTIPYTYA
jgi:hypothetical protein